ncbi:hypothetical protein PGS49_21150 [Yersinia intermedia]|uniref:hypothetical protein n=1 Tax=Yersinia intermedia TaxID=631 RepID=UPI0022FEA9A8|nr:hypothetical protein [Yersinia intermedia]MDA5483129.1 hypothetical protein [Yersinia intermedia]
MKLTIKLRLDIDELSSLNTILKTIYHLVQYCFPLRPMVAEGSQPALSNADVNEAKQPQDELNHSPANNSTDTTKNNE